MTNRRQKRKWAYILAWERIHFRNNQLNFLHLVSASPSFHLNKKRENSNMQKRKGNPGFLNPKTATANILVLSQENCLDGKVDETWKQAPQRGRLWTWKQPPSGVSRAALALMEAGSSRDDRPSPPLCFRVRAMPSAVTPQESYLYPPPTWGPRWPYNKSEFWRPFIKREAGIN